MTEQELLRIRSGVKNLPPGELRDDFMHVLDEVCQLQGENGELRGLVKAMDSEEDGYDPETQTCTDWKHVASEWQADADRLAGVCKRLRAAMDVCPQGNFYHPTVNPDAHIEATFTVQDYRDVNAAIAAHDELKQTKEKSCTVTLKSPTT